MAYPQAIIESHNPQDEATELKTTILTKALCGFISIVFAIVANAQTRASNDPKKIQNNSVPPQGAGAFVYSKNVESVVLIEAEDSSGSRQGSGVAIRNGFAEDANEKYRVASTWIVTNAHVVKDAKHVSVMVDGFRTKGEVVYRDARMDIGLIFLKETVIKTVDIYDKTASLAPGDVVFAIGAPKGLSRSITDGIISAIRRIDGIHLIQTSAAISPGSSGGGLFLPSGEIAGVTTFKIVGGEALNFAIHISQVMIVMDAHYAAEMMRASLDPQYVPMFGDGFVNWLYSASGKTGGTVLDEYNDTARRWAKNELPYEKYDEKTIEIANRYYTLIKTKTPANSQEQNEGRNSERKLLLVCQLSDSNGASPRTESFEIDYANQTINGYPANISSNSMEYTHTNKNGTEYAMVFNRNTSTLTISTQRFPRLLHGMCSKSQGKAF